MKKITIGISLSVLLAILSIYVFIPTIKETAYSAKLPLSFGMATRMLGDTATWRKWWPWNASASQAFPVYGGYSVQLKMAGAAEIRMVWTKENDSTPTILQLFPLGKDTCVFLWTADLAGNNDPISRIMKFSKQRSIKTAMESLTNSILIFADHPEKIYGFQPRIAKVEDTAFISTTGTFASYPTTTDIYTLVEKLETYASQCKVRSTRPPMMHVQKQTDANGQRYAMMVALPIEKKVPTTQNIAVNRMILGNLLVAEVQKGPTALPQLFDQFELFKQDMAFSAPAKPFMVLVTDRRKQTDTSQWVTKFCYPIY